MKTLCCIAAFVLMTVIPAAVGEVNCRFIHFEVQGCIDEGNVDYNRLVSYSYSQEMCSAMQPMIDNCITRNRNRCPDNRVFKGKSGKTINATIKFHGRVCADRDDHRPMGGSGNCPSDLNTFNDSLSHCHDPMMMSFRDDQMCRPMRTIVTCMKRLERSHRACPWLTRGLKQQVLLGANYYAAIRAVKYEC